jgi:hypothetical protein
VLHWRNPALGLPLTFRLYAAGPYDFYLDGRRISSARPAVARGNHVISMVIRDFDVEKTLLLFAVTYEDKTDGKGYEERAAARRILCLSAADGSWKYSASEPKDAAWQMVGFEDSGWSAMVPREWPADREAAKRLPNGYRADELVRMGARGLGVEAGHAGVWIRRSFLVQQTT